MSHMSNLAVELIEYESGNLTYDEMLELFAKLIKSGMAWTLQGHYGRMAAGFIEDGLITDDGDLVARAAV